MDNDLGDYEDALVDDGFDDMEALLAILEEDIDAIGFTIADKRKLMNAVEKFRATADLEYELSDDDLTLSAATRMRSTLRWAAMLRTPRTRSENSAVRALSTAYPKAGIRRVMPILKGSRSDCVSWRRREFSRSPVRLCEC